MRVKVMSGDGKTELGEGNMVGCVPVYFFRFPDGSLGSKKNAEKKPSIFTKIWYRIIGLQIVATDNPKIILDSGDVVYGCQTYWCATED